MLAPLASAKRRRSQNQRSNFGSNRKAGAQLFHAESRMACGCDDAGDGGGMFGGAFDRLILLGFERGWLYRIGFRQNDLIRHGGVVQQFHDHVIGWLDLNTRIEQQNYSAQIGPAAQIIEHEALPITLDGFWCLGIAVTRHINQDDGRGFHLKKIKLACAPWLMRNPRE